MLRKYHPIYLNTHFNHPKELTDESIYALQKLVDSGIPVGNQTVLLRGINDNVSVMKNLCLDLMQVRVRPYYIYQCDLSEGIEHFRTTVNKGIEIMEALRGHISGLAVPTYVIDGPGGGGNITDPFSEAARAAGEIKAPDFSDIKLREGGGGIPGKIRVYLNGGTAGAPQFSGFSYVQSLGSDLEVQSGGCLGAFPRLVQFSDDDKKDLLVGLTNGRVKLYTNVGTDAAPAFDGGVLLRVGPAGSKTPLDVGDRATVAVTDWNNDDVTYLA